MTPSETVGKGRPIAARLCALGAAVGAVLSTAGLVGAGAAARTSDYLSELGVLDAPSATLYRTAVWVAAGALALLGVSLALSVPAVPAGEDAEFPDAGEDAEFTDAEMAESELARPEFGDGGADEPPLSAREHADRSSAFALGNAAALLAGASPFFVASGAIRCSPGCPLPPYDPATTVTDILHAGVSAVGFACAVAAMFVLARGHASRGVRIVSACGAAVVGGAVAVTGIAMLVPSNGVVNGIAERTATVAALVWLAIVGLQLGLRSSGPAGQLDTDAGADGKGPTGDPAATLDGAAGWPGGGPGSAHGTGRAQGLARVPRSEQGTVHE
ncbi:MAG TPA: DUF998 domain-containing protein [Cryptosporangiaceae bacterium]|nr:DUF998 domain-containing protein [Cryptosporangiaceae bacterium]